MDMHITKAEAALMLPATTIPSRRQAAVEAVRLAAIDARDDAMAAAMRRAGHAVLDSAGALVRSVLTFPARLQTYKELRRLSDRELRDIGVTRLDIPRVFDPALAPRAANDSARTAPRAA